jgi:hypothetical protein
MIDYQAERQKYRPDNVSTLLIAEAPPPSGLTFFYVPRELDLSIPIHLDRTLPATIFNHYFKRRPSDVGEYMIFLTELQNTGVFLIDIIDEPLRIRGNPTNEEHLISRIPFLRPKIKEMEIDLEENRWIFLLARNSYNRHIAEHFPHSKRIRWIDFRLGEVNAAQ